MVNFPRRLRKFQFVVMGCAALSGCGTVGPPPSPQQTTQVASLSAADAQNIVQGAASSVADPLVIAVVDRAGRILAVYRKANAPTTATGNFSQTVDANELAVALARTAAFFSNNQAPLSSRTVRFISGIHFPPGVANTASAALYGIENTNRGCTLDATLSIPPARLTNGGTPGLGVITGKKDVMDSDATAVNPGGVPLFKGGEAVGGVGVVAANMDVAEYAAFTGAFGAGFLPPLTGVPSPGAVLIDGIALPFVNQKTLPAGDSTGSTSGYAFVLGPVDSPGPVPEGDLIAAHDGPIGGLKASEVSSIVANAVATANLTRAVIRLPLGQRTRMVIAVADLDGSLLALTRMPDATVFSIDVAVSKARNMVYFNSPTVSPNDLQGVPVGTAVTNRTISFGAQPLFPSGIDGSLPGPFFPLYQNDVTHPCTQGSQPASSNQQSGIVFFPGSEGLYRNGTLVGGLGVSGDGVEQDDYVTAGGAQGWEPAASLRADQIVISGVRLPYLKFPRNPTQ